jgi:hypothetical protein
VLGCLLALGAGGCFIGQGANKSTARDVEKPADPRAPESVLKTVEFDATGVSEAVYEAPADRALVIQDIRLTVPCEVFAEVAGAPLPMLSVDLLETISAGTTGFRSPGGVKLPAGSRLRLRRSSGSDAAEVRVFVSGELVRL